MRLLDLDPQLYRHETYTDSWQQVQGDPLLWKPGDPTVTVVGPRERYVPVSTLAEADGLMLDCPKCRDHKVLCWFFGRVADDVTPKPGRWSPAGTGLHDLTFVPNACSHQTSVQLEGGCSAHFNVVQGEVTWA